MYSRNKKNYSLIGVNINLYAGILLLLIVINDFI